ncbi:hypothetical protein IU479_30765 [Nocardia abscessus]|uniref:DUF6875 domain-containing protein n=2 Tax=Nocardiaceae TaxID=85025 RepID=UPI001892F94A|nr:MULTISPECIES: hypothetical protein [Nocardia]MBF6222480.1 hypothetical protein [Nocardia abscessus]
MEQEQVMSVRILVGARSRVEWFDLFDDTYESDAGVSSTATLREWVRDYLVRPNNDLGRDGPVCPFVKPAVGHHALWSAIAPGDAELTVDRMRSMIDDAFDLFHALTRSAVAGAPQAALLTVFQDLTDYGRVDAVHSLSKDRFVAEGMMLGQFYPGCSQPGLWNRDFRPLDAPLPMLVVRNMMPSDYPFLLGKSEWLFSYLSRFGHALPIKLRRSMAEYLFRAASDTADAITDHRVHSVEDSTDSRPTEHTSGIEVFAGLRQGGR